MSSTTTDLSLQDRVDDLLDHVRQGKILQAIETFYADDVVMTEPSSGATRGKAANLERERAFVAGVKVWRSFDAPAVAVRQTAPGTGVALIENSFEFVNQQDQTVRYEQVSVQRWQDGKIVHERFYYDRGA